MVSGQVKEHLNKFLRVASPLAHNCWCTDIKEGSAAFRRNGLSQHCLASAWWAKKKNTLPRLQDALKEVRVLHGHQHCFFQKTFTISKPNNAWEAYIWISTNNLILNRDCQVTKIWIVAIVWQGFQYPVIKELFYFFICVLGFRLLRNYSALDSEIIIKLTSSGCLALHVNLSAIILWSLLGTLSW